MKSNKGNLMVRAKAIPNLLFLEVHCKKGYIHKKFTKFLLLVYLLFTISLYIRVIKLSRSNKR